MPVGRSPGIDGFVGSANSTHVIGRQRYRIVRRVNRVDVSDDLLGETQGLAECGWVASRKEEEHLAQIEKIAHEEHSRLSVQKGDATRRVTWRVKDLQDAVAEVDAVSML